MARRYRARDSTAVGATNDLAGAGRQAIARLTEPAATDGRPAGRGRRPSRSGSLQLRHSSQHRLRGEDDTADGQARRDDSAGRDDLAEQGGMIWPSKAG